MIIYKGDIKLRIVVVSPHPDDETLGAGGFILKQKQLGNEVYWINMTDVDEKYGWDSEYVNNRRKQINDVCNFYKFNNFYNLKFIPSKLENTDKAEIIERFGKCIHDIRPEWLVLPNPYDAHTDHMITYEVGMSCSKIFRYPYIKRIMTMEILSETDFSKTGEQFSPNYFIDIGDVIEDKVNAMKIYDTELGEPQFPRNLEAIRSLALLRGGTSGCRYAEAFKMIKQIEM